MSTGEKRNTHSVRKFYTVSAATLATLVSLGFINARAQADDQINNQTNVATNTTQVASQSQDNNSNVVTVTDNANSALSANTTTSSATPVVTATTESKTAVNSSTPVASSADTIDISAYQPNMTVGTFQNYKNMGVQNVVVKLTESTGWTNEYAQSQIKNAQTAGMNVSAYHFVRFTNAIQAQAEANHFASVARQVGLGNDTLMIADVESVSETRYAGIVNNLNVFWNTLSSLGYTNHAVYTGLDYDKQYNVSSTVGKDRTWVAMYYYDYRATPIRINYKRSLGYGAWQYTDRFNGAVDGTIDFGLFKNYSHGITQAANLDNMSISAASNTLNVSGWFADNSNQGKDNRYVILLDQDNGSREVARQQVSAVTRNDVQSAYPSIYGTNNSGFNASFQLTGALAQAIGAGHRIQAIIRYTSSNDGNSDYNDHYFNGVSFVQNNAYLDSFNLTNNGIHVSGWHATNQSISRPYDYVILYDKTTKREIARQQVSATSRADVQNAYQNVYQSGKSGFNVDFAMNDALRSAIANGDAIQVVTRYTDNAAGNGNAVDVWFDAKTFNQDSACVDSFELKNGQIEVTGWHAADQSVADPYQWIILIDNVTGKEVARVKASTVSRPDVAQAYPGITNSGNSGFKVSFKVADHAALQSALIQGHALKVVARYSDDAQNGEGHRVDYWVNNPKRFSSNVSHSNLDSFYRNGTVVRATGWFADDRSVGAKTKYIILYDATTNREITRKVVTNGSFRSDVARVYPSVYGADQSGFDVSFDASQNQVLANALKNGHMLQIITRYSDAQNGEGNYVQYWFGARTL
ncbi:GH25 family lysozyme [Limosilactobacillus fastidiosus]|uniref:Glycosyl hydrolase family 25 n=1 Tax=Limosilactobacillus fastidiosus TaxID=2759855 RepID=A0ABR6E6J5_9LACO|nr:GH25 family lysozyme [Limosilactobacillus fastidiosus]MBB1062627.1 glycosyl hydrolase family 25 [Limosilactobacillus fastidiosus]MCD7083969.1 glycosyl hydrolase family 25 [Limosilactobacillus fastidiosus]